MSWEWQPDGRTRRAINQGDAKFRAWQKQLAERLEQERRQRRRLTQEQQNADG